MATLWNTAILIDSNKADVLQSESISWQNISKIRLKYQMNEKQN